MTKVYELPNGHRMVADFDESTRVCNITEAALDSLVSKLNYYAEQTDVLDKIRAEIDGIEINGHIRDVECFRAGINTALNVIDKYRGDKNEANH